MTLPSFIIAADAAWWTQGQRHIKLLATEVTRMRMEIQVRLSLRSIACIMGSSWSKVSVFWHLAGINFSPPTRVAPGAGEQAGLEERR